MLAASDTRPPGGAAWRCVFVAILLLAGFLRAYKLDLMSVTDATAAQGLAASAALALDGWDWPLVGPATEGVRSSSFLVTAIAIASSIYRHPFSGVVFVIILNVCALGLAYRLCAKQFGSQVAAIATLLYAVSPLCVLSARSPLPSSCLALFSVALVHLSLRWISEGGDQRLALAVLLAFAIPQVHFSGVCVFLWLIAVLYVGRKQISYPSLVTGGLFGALLWIPWIVFQHRQGWLELSTWLAQVSSPPAAHRHAFLQSINHVHGMLHSANFDEWFGGTPSTWPEYFPAWQRVGLVVSAWLLGGLLLAAVIRCLMRTADYRMWLLLLWVALPVLFGSLFATGFSPEDMWIAYPIPFVLIGVMTVRLQEWLPRRIRLVPFAGMLAIAAGHVLFLASASRFVADGRASSNGRYALSYRQRQATIRSVIEDAAKGPVWLVGASSGSNPAYEFVLLWEQPNRRMRRIEKPICYWIDEKRPAAGLSAAVLKDRKEREVNPLIAEALHTPPDWEIERHWSVEKSQVYRLRLVEKAPLQ